MSKYLAFIVLGGPGSGKGTQCAKLAETFGYLHISAGDLLRAEVQSASPTSTLINSYIRDGKIVPSEITVGLLKKAIDTSTADTVLVDGFPRALDQIDEFNRMCATDCAFVLFFDCPEDLLMTRLIKRGETSGRADDNAESIKKRFVTYREQSYPVIEKYDGMGKVKRVDSSVGTIDEVFSQVRSLFEPSILSGTAATAPRPPSAHGTFLRILTINDVYTLENYPHFASAVVAARKAAADLDCKVISTLNGDFLSPCVLTALDGGRAMVQGLNLAEADYVGLGNHELDLGYEGLNARLSETKPTVINSNLVSVQDKAISNDVAPNFATIQIGERWAVMGGFVTDDMSIYAPFLKPKILPVDECLNVAWNSGMTSLRASKQIGSTALPDLFIPMTHQLTPQDRTTGTAIAKHSELSTRTPVILAGHDHEQFIEDAGKSVLVKVGSDAERFGVIDIWWTATGEMRHRISVLPVTEFPREPQAAAFAKNRSDFLHTLMDAPLAKLAEGGSTKRVRFEESSVASWLLGCVRRGLGVGSHAAEVAIVQGGGIRADKEYAKDHEFTVGDLFAEFAFDLNMAVIDLPGHVLADSVANSRNAPKPAPTFLHLDDGCRVNPEGHILTHVNGNVLERDRVYTVAIYQMLLTGLNAVEPLVSYAKANCTIPDLDSCRPAKEIVLEVCFKEAWLEVIGLDVNTLHSAAAFEAALDSFLAEVGSSGDGMIDSIELEDFMVKKQHEALKGGDLNSRHAFISRLMKTLDSNDDGMISREELRSLSNYDVQAE